MILQNEKKTATSNSSAPICDTTLLLYRWLPELIPATLSLVFFIIKKLFYNKKKRGTVLNCEVSVLVNDTDVITSVITSESAKELNLELNQEIYAIIKSSDIMIGN